MGSVASPPSSHRHDRVRELAIELLLRRETAPLTDAQVVDLMPYAEEQGILPLLATRLLTRGDLGRETRELLETHLHRVAAAEIILQREIQRVLEGAHEERVDLIVLKGTALAYSLYEEPFLRPRVDTDVILAEENLPRLRALLTRRGYVERDSWAGDLHQPQRMFQRALLPNLTLSWDVHWRLSNRFALGSRFTWDDLWSATMPLPALAAGARSLRRSWALLHACIHLLAHREEERRLIWDWDIRCLVESSTAEDREEFRGLSRRYDLREPIAQASNHLRERGVYDPSIDFPELLVGGDGASDRPTRRLLQELATLPGLSLKTRWIAQLLFPSRLALEKRYGRNIPILLTPLYMVHRWIQGALRMIGHRR